jgi:hypothetical protein
MFWVFAVGVSVVLSAIGIFFWPEKKYKPPVWHN